MMTMWRSSTVAKPESAPVVRVVEQDWGAATLDYTKRYGVMFAVLNMANENSCGGGHLGGAAAQEENMFRRTDASLYCPGDNRYDRETKAVIGGQRDEVYLDKIPRICFRNGETSTDIKSSPRKLCNYGYTFLHPDEYFPFLELRAAALDLRKYSEAEKESPWVGAEMTKRIRAQLRTLVNKSCQHVILSAFGCGAFLNNPEKVATIYKQLLLAEFKSAFKVVVFAIVPNPGMDNTNFTKFHKVLHEIF